MSTEATGNTGPSRKAIEHRKGYKSMFAGFAILGASMLANLLDPWATAPAVHDALFAAQWIVVLVVAYGAAKFCQMVIEDLRSAKSARRYSRQ